MLYVQVAQMFSYFFVQFVRSFRPGNMLDLGHKHTSGAQYRRVFQQSRFIHRQDNVSTFRAFSGFVCPENAFLLSC